MARKGQPSLNIPASDSDGGLLESVTFSKGAGPCREGLKSIVKTVGYEEHASKASCFTVIIQHGRQRPLRTGPVGQKTT